MRVSPGEFFLTFCSSCQLGDSLASTMRLRTPSCSMKAMTFCCAPAPMESMATTAATPKIMPSMVRRERSLWLARFSKPKTTSGSHCCSDRGSAKELAFMGVCLTSLRARTDTGIGCVASLLFSGEIFLGIHEGHDRSRRNTIEDRSAFTQRTDFDFLHFETPVAFAIHYLLAVGFAYLRRYFQVRDVDDFRDGASRIDLIADVIVRQRHPIHEESARRIPVAVNHDKTVNRRGDVHVLDVLFRLLHCESRLMTFLLGERQRRLI